MNSPIFIFTPPFTQLNTPYPATAYLKGFLNTKKIKSVQADLGIEVILEIFTQNGLQNLMSKFENNPQSLSQNANRIISLKDSYLKCIDSVILFLQGNNPTLAFTICQDNYLPQASRFQQLDDLQWAFGSMGIQDKAKHLATLFLEDISDFIKECVDEHFGFSRYAEKLARSANSFDELYEKLNDEETFIDKITLQILEKYIKNIEPELVAISVPFPGNLYAALRCGGWIKNNYPNIKIVMGGGFPNTELRSLTDARVFEFVDFITLDDGETPIENLIQYLKNETDIEMLKRTFTLVNKKVAYINNSLQRDYKQSEVGTPDYSDFKLNKYISAIEIMNPMHRLWSDGRWNKLTMAHGCYWGKCTFCDISLDYIKNYEPVTASIICDRIEEIILQTNEHGFHFVDEAAPPSLMKALAIEIIKRKLTITWWTNIRFEKSFTADLCFLLKESGCIGVSGGLEVASDRLLQLIDKGITVAQVAQVTQSFSEAGIMVHAYLMYGFPTQTMQETIDSLEMVRQMFLNGVLQSAFWHQFTMTAHSPIGLNPEHFSVKKKNNLIATFANNDIEHDDAKGARHEQFGFGLKKSLLNYMHQLGLDEPLQKWFDFKTPTTSIDKNYIENNLKQLNANLKIKPNAQVIWLGSKVTISLYTKSKKGTQWQMGLVKIESNSKTIELKMTQLQATWLVAILEKCWIHESKKMNFELIKNEYILQHHDEDFELFWFNKIRPALLHCGLVCV